MDSYIKHRSDYPLSGFETRVLPAVDGVPRLLTLGSWYWEKLDECIANNYNSLEDVTAFCVDYAKSKAAKSPEFEVGYVLYNSFMYYIFGSYYRYIQCRDDIANDFWPPH